MAGVADIRQVSNLGMEETEVLEANGLRGLGLLFVRPSGA